MIPVCRHTHCQAINFIVVRRFAFRASENSEPLKSERSTCESSSRSPTRSVHARGVSVCVLVLVRPLLWLVITLQGLPRRVSCAQGAEVGEAAHRSSHHVFGCCRPPIGLGLLGPIARDGDPSGAGSRKQVAEEQPYLKGFRPSDWQQSEGGSGSSLGNPQWPVLDCRFRC